MNRGIKAHIKQILSDGTPRTATEIISEFAKKYPECETHFKTIRVTLSKELNYMYPEWKITTDGMYFIPLSP